MMNFLYIDENKITSFNQNMFADFLFGIVPDIPKIIPAPKGQLRPFKASVSSDGLMRNDKADKVTSRPLLPSGSHGLQHPLLRRVSFVGTRLLPPSGTLPRIATPPLGPGGKGCLSLSPRLHAGFGIQEITHLIAFVWVGTKWMLP